MTVPSNAALAQQISDLLALWNSFMSGFRDWSVGTVTGGYNADGTVSNGTAPNGGYYPLNDGVGNVYYVPSPGKMTHDTMKGDKGNAADADISFFIAYQVGPSEEFMAYVSPVAATYDMTKAKAYADITSQGTAIIQMQKALSATPNTWTNINTLTFTAGQNLAAISAGNISLAAGDRVRWVGPTTMDQSLGQMSFSFPGANINPGP